MDLDAERNRCQEIILQKNELELQLATIQDAQSVAAQQKKALKAIKAREDLEMTIRALVRDTAPTIDSYKEGDNVLYMARIDGIKFKYGHTKNLKQRFDSHGRTYPTFDIIKILQCANGVASEDIMRGYVKKEKIGVEYGTQREIITLGTVDELHRFIKKMQKYTTSPVSTQPANEGTELQLIEAKTKAIEINACLEMKRMDVDVQMKWMKMLKENTITFEQYLQIKN